ncbi:hypothetical protein DM860_001825 [Cuscuta australis]|uniref:Agenet domain-containing protein n=1 Tax=Cuscuta australis TaxID=267555 RepID=A0A328EA24_9ASTE|nr:hypothetical protein DM860_001825 [Cuscuta australis]
MDYNGNDYHSKNLHLAGEDSSKVSSVLRPFSLPRFDFDDSLQGHLRFDSLVENEVFLGIPCQEDNQWIEDFPRGSSGIVEFSSSATGPCTITGRNNVWHEVTSPESVEMLLKSVGQEHNVPQYTTIPESDSGKELGNVTNDTEPSLREDDKMDHVGGPMSGITNPFLDNFSRSREITDGEVDQFKCKPPVASPSSEIDASTESAELTAEKSLHFIELENIYRNDTGVAASHNVVLVNQNKEDPCVPLILENPNDHTKKNDMNEVDFRSDDCIIKDSTPDFTSEAEYVEEVGEGNTSPNLDESLNLLQNEECDLLSPEECKENLLSAEPSQVINSHIIGSSDFKESKPQIEGDSMQHDEQSLPLKSICASDGHDKEKVRDTADHVSNPEREEHFLIKMPYEQNSANEQEHNTIANFSSDYKLPSGSNLDHEGDIASPRDICILDESLAETPVAACENLIGEKDALRIYKVDYCDGNVSSHARDESEKICSEALSSKQLIKLDNCDQDVSCCERGEMMPTTVDSDAENYNPLHHQVETGSSLDEECIKHIENAHGSELGTSTMHKQASNSEVGDVDHPSHDTLDSASMTEVSDAPAGLVMQCEEVPLPVKGELMHLERKDEMDIACPAEANVSKLGSSLFMANQLGHAPDVENDPSVPTPLAVSVPMTETTDTETKTEASDVPAAVVKQCEEVLLTVQEELMHLHKKEEMSTICPEEANLSELGSSIHMASQIGPCLDVEKDSSGSTPLTVSISMIEAADAETNTEKTDIPTAAVKQCEEVSLPVEGELMPLHSKDEMGTVCAAEANLSDLGSSLHMASQPGLVPDVEKDQSVPTPLTASVPLIKAANTETKTDPVSACGEIHPDCAVAGDIGHQHESVYQCTPLETSHSNSMIEASDTETKADQASASGEVHLDQKMTETKTDSTSVSGEVNQGISIVEQKGYQQDSAAEKEDNNANDTVGKHLETESEGKQASNTEGREDCKEQGAPELCSTAVTTCIQVVLSKRKKQEVGNNGAAESVPSPEGTDDFGAKVQSMCLDFSVDSSKKEMGKDLRSYPSSKTPEVKMETSQPINMATPSVGAKGSSEQKVRRRSGKLGRESSRKGNRVKESPVKFSDRVDSSCVELGSSVAAQLVQFDAGSVQRFGTKTSNVCNSISILPDLNSSASPISFQQPFTDLQQVQLRAQIFVYGSLIQGSAPDEAIMVSAFGTSEGGRGVWEPAWRSCVERLHGQKSPIIGPEGAGEPGSGLKTPDQARKPVSHHSKSISSTAPRPSISRGTSIPIISPMIPLSTPLWSIASPSCDGLPPSSMTKGAFVGYQAVSPLHPYQTPPMRNFIGPNCSWLSQTPLPAPWVASTQTSAFNNSMTHIPVIPIADPVNLIPSKESSGLSCGTKYAPPSSVAPCMLPSGVLVDTLAQQSTEQRSKKRKKTSCTEVPGQTSLSILPAEPVPAPSINCNLSKVPHLSECVGDTSLIDGSQTGTLMTTIASNCFSSPVAVITPSFVSKSKSNLVSPSISFHHYEREDNNLEKAKLTPLDLNSIEDVKLHSDEAAEHAAAALGHCQGIWSELEKQKNSGLMSDLETKLASAAATIAAAASVARAAAAAAKIASNAASQAWLMADEALSSSTSACPESTIDSHSDFLKSMGSATPASILRGGGGPNCSGSVIFAAREAARRRIEVASAASRHAENLDSIVKAAELAAEAVSHAGKVVSMGDPLTLSELVEAGPDGYWKVPKAPGEYCVKSNNGKSDFDGFEKSSDGFLEKAEGPRKALQALTMGPLSVPVEVSIGVEEGSTNTMKGNVEVEDDISPSKGCSEKDMSGNKIPMPEVESRLTTIHEDHGKGISSTSGEDIKEGCLVEVFRDSGDAWFMANVLSLKDGKAFVSYTEPPLGKGLRHPNDWIPLCTDGDEVPRIRPAQTMTAVHSEGARKRRRAEVRHYSWSVGDQVDAWIHDCWREGIIIEKNKKDETTFTVNFPARGDNVVVRVWNLRPRLVWKDGEWIEWFTRKEQSSQGDTPKEKRMKLGNATSEESREKANVTTNIDMPELDTIEEEPKLIPLSEEERKFNIGSLRNENSKPKPAPHRTMRSGLLQKQRSKVVFGVPSPGKKRKFMDVSKHYDSNRGGVKTTIASSTNDSGKYGIPARSGFGGWRNSSKMDDPKEKKFMAESKSKPPLRSRKPPTASSKILRDNILRSSPTTSGDASHEMSDSGHSDSVKFGPSAEEVAESKAFPAEPVAKKGSRLRNRSERTNRGNSATVGGKSAKQEMVSNTAASEINEPRRSNRKIQPTSRLLEGLQSSLILPKLPSVSHDKVVKSHNRGPTSKG